MFREALCMDPSEVAFALDEIWVTRVSFAPKAYIENMVGRFLLALIVFQWKIGVV